MGFGDEILAAGQAANAHRQNPTMKVAICDSRLRPRFHELWEGNPIIATREDIVSGAPVLRIRNAAGCRPYIRYPFTTDTGFRYVKGWRAQDHRGSIYLADHELRPAEQLREEIGPYVLIEPSLKSTQTRNKDWGFDRYAELVRTLPSVRWVRLVHGETRPLPGAHEILRPLTFREVVGILGRALAYVGPEGGLHHAAAAVQTPAVVLFGGCIDPAVMGYPEQVTLADKRPGSPCCRFLHCRHCIAAMARIRVHDVASAVLATLDCQRVAGVAS